MFRPSAALISKNKSNSTHNTTTQLALIKFRLPYQTGNLISFYDLVVIRGFLLFKSRQQSSDISLKASLGSLFLLTCAVTPVQNYPSHFTQPVFSTTDLV